LETSESWTGIAGQSEKSYLGPSSIMATYFGLGYLPECGLLGSAAYLQTCMFLRHHAVMCMMLHGHLAGFPVQ